jgi:predicted outer membrane repeat protein
MYTDWEHRGLRSACVFLADGVILLSEAGPSATTIDMQGAGTGLADVVFSDQIASPTTVMEGFTITGVMFARSGALVVGTGKITFRDCVFRDMDGGSFGAAGLVSWCDVDVVDCEFRDLKCITGGAGIFMSNEADLFVDRCLFTNCVERAINAYAQDPLVPEQAVIRNSSFIGNSESGSGGGGAVNLISYQSGVTISGCYFENNVAVGSGGAIQVGGPQVGPWTVQDCVFWNNRTTIGGGGGGALSTGGSGTVSGSTFDHNTAFGAGAAAAFQVGSIRFKNNVVSGSIGSPAVYEFSGTVVSSCSVYWDNAAGDAFGFNLSATDRVIDPLYCDPTIGDFTVFDTSPCLPANSAGCGQIGALGKGCGSVAVQARSWGRIKGGYR